MKILTATTFQEAIEELQKLQLRLKEEGEQNGLRAVLEQAKKEAVLLAAAFIEDERARAQELRQHYMAEYERVQEEMVDTIRRLFEQWYELDGTPAALYEEGMTFRLPPLNANAVHRVNLELGRLTQKKLTGPVAIKNECRTLWSWLQTITPEKLVLEKLSENNPA